MFGFIKKIFVVLLTSIVNTFNHTKRVFLSNQQCKTRVTVIHLHPNEYCQRLHYYPFYYIIVLSINLDRLVGSCNILNPI